MNEAWDSPREQSSYLLHLTEGPNELSSIINEGAVRALNPYGAAYNHIALRQSQCVSCFSEIPLPDVARLASRHGEFGVAFLRGRVQAAGAAPVWYLPRDSPLQRRLFDIIKGLGYGSNPALDHSIWELTPFIDYPRDYTATAAGVPYDWRWEREWRVRGDFHFEPADVALIFAPENAQAMIAEMWLWEALDADLGLLPPVIDVHWPIERIRQVLEQGESPVVSEFA